MYYKRFYIQCRGVCVNSYHRRRIGYSVWYRYTVKDSEEEFVRLGPAFLKPKIGDSYKILVCENDHNKVLGYNYYLSILYFGIFLLFVDLVLLILWIVFS